MARIGGNPNIYGKGGGVKGRSGRKSISEEFNLVRAIDKYSPVFWKIISEWMECEDKDKQKFALTEFNKLQIRRVPQNLDLTSNGKTLSRLCEAIEQE